MPHSPSTLIIQDRAAERRGAVEGIQAAQDGGTVGVVRGHGFCAGGELVAQRGQVRFGPVGGDVRVGLVCHGVDHSSTGGAE